MPYNTDVEKMQAFNAKGIILSGGPASVTWSEAPRAPQWVFDSGLPILGICYGLQTICQQLDGEVVPSDHQEFGRADVNIVESSPLFEGVWDKDKSYPVWMSHGDHASKLPTGFKLIAKSEGAPIAAIADDARKYYATQFHMEVAHTPEGEKLIRNFVRNIVGCTGDWGMAMFREKTVQRIREQVGDGKVICGLSGGVDSSVAAVLMHEAIGDNLTCIFVDHGLLRQGEGQEVSLTCSLDVWLALVTQSKSAKLLVLVSLRYSSKRRTKSVALISLVRARFTLTLLSLSHSLGVQA